jgi:hypothetical protein
MEPHSYAMLLAEYASRFGELPPSIFTDEGAGALMAQALDRGRPIAAADLRPLPADETPARMNNVQ